MTIICPNLAEALAFFTERLGFRLDMIMPADDPRVAVLSKGGESVRLEAETRPAGSASLMSERHTPPLSCLRLCRHDKGEWIAGRAGMEYRDLVPGRLGGEMVASHIRLTKGGEVADYVHYHKVAFQMIFCLAGAIKVVYEDQGEPFWLRLGDCVLQPPEIRHRVLEAAAGSEVIEIGCPAVHETWVDHELRLPTAEYRPRREFGGQRFVRHVAKDADASRAAAEGCEVVDTGISEATDGLAAVSIVKLFGEPGVAGSDFDASGSSHFLFVLDGRVKVDVPGEYSLELSPNDSLFLESAGKIFPSAGETCKFLAVTLPCATGQWSMSCEQ